MRVAILGDGLLGTELSKQTGWKVISRSKDGFDITKPEEWDKYFTEVFDGVAISTKYNIIINCIANTQTYSIDKKAHWNVNYKGVADLVDYCNEHNIKLVHISTDYVYTNSDPYVSEDDVPIHGNNWYSYTKLLADAYVELRSNNYLLCRETHKPYPFPYEEAWVDQVGNFDYVDVISNIIIDLIENNAEGVYNVGTELKSMYDLAKMTNPDVHSSLKNSRIPSNTSMNLLKLYDFYNNL